MFSPSLANVFTCLHIKNTIGNDVILILSLFKMCGVLS